MTNQQALQTGDVSSCTNVCNNVVRTQANEPKLPHLSGVTWRYSLHQFPDHDQQLAGSLEYDVYLCRGLPMVLARMTKVLAVMALTWPTLMVCPGAMA